MKIGNVRLNEYILSEMYFLDTLFYIRTEDVVDDHKIIVWYKINYNPNNINLNFSEALDMVKDTNELYRLNKHYDILQRGTFHNNYIKKGKYGELSKIEEELNEAKDAEESNQKLMFIIELSDIVGAVAGVANKYNFSIDDLVLFSKKRSEVIKYEISKTE